MGLTGPKSRCQQSLPFGSEGEKRFPSLLQFLGAACVLGLLAPPPKVSKGGLVFSTESLVTLLPPSATSTEPVQVFSGYHNSRGPKQQKGVVSGFWRPRVPGQGAGTVHSPRGLGGGSVPVLAPLLELPTFSLSAHHPPSVPVCPNLLLL